MFSSLFDTFSAFNPSSLHAVLSLALPQVVAVSPRLLERNNPDFVALAREVVMLVKSFITPSSSTGMKVHAGQNY